MSAFNDMYGKVRDRNWGGTAVTVACEPYISGYSFISFLHMPADLTNVLSNSIDYIGLQTAQHNKPGKTYDHVTASATQSATAGVFLEHAMNSVTPPGGTINKVEIQGLGGSKWAVPGGMDYQNSISIKYLEFSGLPVARIHRAWCNMIRDNRMGTTHMDNSGAGHGAAYNKQNYAATMAYWTTKPDGCTVEFCAIYTGMFPTKDPMDLFSGDITSIDKLEIEIEYNVDMIYNDNWVRDYVQDKLALNCPNGATNHTTWMGWTGRWQGSYRGSEEHSIAQNTTQGNGPVKTHDPRAGWTGPKVTEGAEIG